MSKINTKMNPSRLGKVHTRVTIPKRVLDSAKIYKVVSRYTK